MKYTILYYTTLITGIVVFLVGVQNLYTFWGEVSFAGLVGQATGFICIVGGAVNLVVAYKFKVLIDKIKAIKAPEIVDL